MSASEISPAKVVAQARLWLGTPYQHQASLIGVGCDCLGLVRGVWRGVVGPEPVPVLPYTPDWAEAGGVEQLAEAGAQFFTPIALTAFSVGDLLLFRWRDNLPAKHLAIVSGAQSMIHAHDGACVAEVSIGPWWRRRLAFAFRFPGISA